jgi:hypothetical protein
MGKHPLSIWLCVHPQQRGSQRLTQLARKAARDHHGWNRAWSKCLNATNGGRELGARALLLLEHGAVNGRGVDTAVQQPRQRLQMRA